MNIDIPGADVKKGLDVEDGSPEFYARVLRSFVTHTPALLDKIKKVSKEALPDYRTAVHTLKGATATIGADEISKTAAELEVLAKAGHFAEIAALNGKLVQSTEVLMGNIQSWLKNNGG